MSGGAEKTGTLWGVGVGPGDPELLTLKAVRILREADIIAVPDTGGERQLALQIAAEHCGGKELLLCRAPMVRDRALRAEAWERAADAVCEKLREGKQAAFVTLGDPSIYSTWSYLQRAVEKRGFATRTVPGIPSFCAAAAELGRPLCEDNERLLIVPASHSGLEESLNIPANKVLMKAGRQLGALCNQLDERGELDGAALAANCGLPGERLIPNLAEERPENGYFAVVLLRERKQGNTPAR